MNEIIEPLAWLPGVRLAAFVTADGVPVSVPGKRTTPGGAEANGTSGPMSISTDALAGLAAGWLDELARAVGHMSWNSPRRVVLRTARGTLILLAASGSVLVVLLEGHLGPEDLRLPMEGAAARIDRQLRNMGAGEPQAVDAAVRGPLPARGGSSASPRQSVRHGTPSEADQPPGM